MQNNLSVCPLYRIRKKTAWNISTYTDNDKRTGWPLPEDAHAENTAGEKRHLHRKSRPWQITIPLICTFIPIISGRGALYFFPNWKREITILVILTTIPLLWLVIVKAAAAFTTSIGFENGYCTLSYCKWYSFHKSIAALDRVSMVTVMQNPFQKISHTCAVRVYTNSESTDYHTVKGLNYDKVIKLLNRNGYAVWKNEEWGVRNEELA